MTVNLFADLLISANVQAQLPKGYRIRPLAIDDYDRGVLKLLSQLSVVGEVSKDQFIERFEHMRNLKTYFITVIHEESTDRTVAVGTLVVEYKFLHECGKIGHIEDIVVDDSQRGKKFGQRLIDQLQYTARAIGCYKVILNCTLHNVPFYEKCGLHQKDVQMANYFEPLLIREEEKIQRENWRKFEHRRNSGLGLSPMAERSFHQMLHEVEEARLNKLRETDDERDERQVGTTIAGVLSEEEKVQTVTGSLKILTIETKTDGAK
ncbi:acyl-CoA N-acyltransferase [Jimgerdemannia flammicorona]|uniref:Glucosamine 6-phosphate N-acetyltransferase n=1 Tax=Jimgerdemannia flammicorona TaxID=994334 RepID=A0A433QRD7_9FUNG|nr:acyl-CoA N-acyltransferase [Jimgerdemannia flammicorona]